MAGGAGRTMGAAALTGGLTGGRGAAVGEFGPAPLIAPPLGFATAWLGGRSSPDGGGFGAGVRDTVDGFTACADLAGGGLDAGFATALVAATPAPTTAAGRFEANAFLSTWWTVVLPSRREMRSTPVSTDLSLVRAGCLRKFDSAVAFVPGSAWVWIASSVAPLNPGLPNWSDILAFFARMSCSIFLTDGLADCTYFASTRRDRPVSGSVTRRSPCPCPWLRFSTRCP